MKDKRVNEAEYDRDAGTNIGTYRAECEETTDQGLKSIKIKGKHHHTNTPRSVRQEPQHAEPRSPGTLKGGGTRPSLPSKPE